MRGLIAALLLLSGSAFGQVKLAYVGEISGPLAPSGGNFRDGVILAVEEINARGGVLKQKLDLTLFDTQTNPGVARAQMQKAIDGDPYMIFGPILSGNVKVTLDMVKNAEIPQFVGGEAAELTSRSACRRSRTTSATSSRPRPSHSSG
jgi:branched-chain amino acid transport system substrate-binding protein